MNELKSNFFSKFQKHLQDAEKSFQKEAYLLQDEVQKLNKVYQKKLTQIDKLYESEEKKHNSDLKSLQNTYQADTKKLTETAIEKTKNKETKAAELKAKWQADQKTIEASFKSKLDDKKKALESTETKRQQTEKQILTEYKASKKRLNTIKTQTSEITKSAQEPFLNSLRYYLNRLKDGASDDQKYFKKELASIKKEIKGLTSKEQNLNQTTYQNIEDSLLQSESIKQSMAKEIKSINTKTKSFLTQTKKRYTKSLESFSDSIKTMHKEVQTLSTKIQKLIESNHQTSIDLLANFYTLETKADKESLREIKETEQRNHQTLTRVYDELFTWLKTFEEYTGSIKKQYTDSYQALMDSQENKLNQIIDENELLFQQLTQYTASEHIIDLLGTNQFKDTYLDVFEGLVSPLLDFQKQWHATLYKVYNEAQEYYEELDEIQNFYDGFNEEKAIAFENENLHITKKSAQLNIEIETAKKTYEVETLDADQKILFEKKNNAYLTKIYDSEKQLEKTRLSNTYRSKELDVMNAIKKAKSEFNLRERFFTIEKDLLTDKKNYQIAVKKETFGIQKLEQVKQLAIEKNDLVLSQEAELEQHKVSIVAAKTNLSKVKEDKRQYGLDLENTYQTLRNQNISDIQRQIDDHQVELKRLSFEEDKELRDINQVMHDESLVARNRIKEFDSALKNRLQSINKPYKTSLKQMDNFYSILKDPSSTLEELVSVTSDDFKRELLLSLDSFYDTLKWTREYYSGLEIAKIKRSSATPKKQTSEIERHETSESRYKESLLTYLNVAKSKLEDLFNHLSNKIKQQSFTRSKDFTRALETFLNDALSILEEQATSTSKEVTILFEYIKEQDIAFVEEIEYGASTAVDEIRTRYASIRVPFDETILLLKEDFKSIKSSVLIIPNEEESLHISKLEQSIVQAENTLKELENETYQKEERFKSELQNLELEFDRKQESITHQEVNALQYLESQFEQEKERIQQKIDQAESHFKNIEASELQKLLQAKQNHDYGVQALERKYQSLLMRDQEKLEKLTREQEIRKMESERKLSRTIDDIQKEISSKELQLEAANEKVQREYETLYFDKQTRSQTLNERLDQLQKTLFYKKESLLNDLTEAIFKANQKVNGSLSVNRIKEDISAKFDAHQNYIDTFIETKSNAFKNSL